MGYNYLMPVERTARNRLALYIGLLLLVGAPYLLAWISTGEERIFGGFLFNPIDGYSYLAKMRQGWQGSWRFSLPFTSEPGNGAYIYLFYLALGHAARLLAVPLLVMYHAARFAGSVFMVWSLVHFYDRSLVERKGVHNALFLAVFGSGLGWLALAGGLFTSDLWVSEAYPFLSAYNNPHFSFSLGLLVYLLAPDRENGEPVRRPMAAKDWLINWRFGLAALALAELSPFGSVLALLVCGLLAVWEQWELRTFKPAGGWLLRSLWIGLGAAPVLIYTLWAVQADSALATWNAQNLTPSPPWWDLVIALSPALPLAVLGVVFALRKGERRLRPVVIWALLALLVVYLPLGLQRRFLIGIFIPLALLAVYGVLQLSRNRGSGRMLLLALALLSLPSNLVVLLAGWQGIASKDERIYLSTEEVDGLNWLADNTPEHALVLAGTESGLFIPAWSGRRVIYGHPFETVDAEVELAVVEDFFSGRLSLQDASDMIAERGVDFIYCGPREECGRIAGALLLVEQFEAVYQNSTVRILRVVQEKSHLPSDSEGSQ